MCRVERFSGIVVAIVSVLTVSGAAGQVSVPSTEVTQTVSQTVPDWVGKLPLTKPELAAALVQATPDDYTGSDFQVKPGQFDPFQTYLVQGAWLHGIGCPHNAKVVTFNAEGELVEGTFSEPACTAAADLADTRVEGLLLVKTGITPNIASAFGRIVGVKGKTITELGWDIRKALGLASPNGSHCGGGAPRWNVVIDGQVFFVGCNSGVAQVDGQAWIRQRWVAPIIGFGPLGPEDISGRPIESLTIIFDEASDTGPDFFGAAILDNITINGVMAGRGAVQAK